jgi:hypothetical protein
MRVPTSFISTVIIDENEQLKNISDVLVRRKTYIINMLEFLIDNIFVIFGGRVFQQTVGIPMGYILCSSSRRLIPLFV